MIERYSTPEFIELWSEKTKYNIWLEVEAAATASLYDDGLIPEGIADKIKNIKITEKAIKDIKSIEKDVRHDVIAFVTYLEQKLGENGRWVHRGMTSSDVVDTAFALQLVKASDLLIKDLTNLIEVLIFMSIQHQDTLMMGRSHGVNAEPITFGVMLAGHLAEFKRARARLNSAKAEISVGKLSGAVGTYVHLSPMAERLAMDRLGLRQEPVSTQIVPRDRHAFFFMTIALIATSIERLATNIRHLQKTETKEIAEGFSKKQKGSSAMPHKRNPILCENLCGLARVVRGYLTPAFEDVVLWHERDISHSSVERIIAPDATSTLSFMLQRMAKIIGNLEVDVQRMSQNVSKNQLYESENLMLALVDKGMSRKEAYEIVQPLALKAYNEDIPFVPMVLGNAEMLNYLNSEELAACFNLAKYTRWTGAIIHRVANVRETDRSRTKFKEPDHFG